MLIARKQIELIKSPLDYIPLSRAKQHLRVLHSNDDAYITDLLSGAFAIASKSVGFPAGSAPPFRAATSIALICFAKALDRFESISAFFRLIVAHLEWPDIMRQPSVHSRRCFQ